MERLQHFIATKKDAGIRRKYLSNIGSRRGMREWVVKEPIISAKIGQPVLVHEFIGSIIPDDHAKMGVRERSHDTQQRSCV